MLDHGYGLVKIDEEIEAIEGLDPEQKSALWAWAWTFDDMGRQRYSAHGAARASSTNSGRALRLDASCKTCWEDDVADLERPFDAS